MHELVAVEEPVRRTQCHHTHGDLETRGTPVQRFNPREHTGWRREQLKAGIWAVKLTRDGIEDC